MEEGVWEGGEAGMAALSCHVSQSVREKVPAKMDGRMDGGF